MTIFKADCSNHDWGRGPMDVAAMRRDGIDVFIHKATDGNRFYRDPYFGEAMRRARSAGMPVTGAYHVLWNGNVTGQVDWFIDTVLAAAPWAATEPFEWMWDCEPFGYNGGAPSTATINAACDRLMQRLPDHRPLAYCPRWAYGDLSGMRCPVVASSYGTNPAVGYRQAYPGDGSSRWGAYGGVGAPVVLQYGSTTTVGSQPTVDANAYRGTVDQFRALITGDTMTALDQGQANQLADVERYESAEHTALATHLGLLSPTMTKVDDGTSFPVVYGWPGGPTTMPAISVALYKLGEEILSAVKGVTPANIGAPTQAQVDAAMLKALQDPAVLKGIGDAIAVHLHVT